MADVLVVDDDAGLRAMMSAILKKAGHRVTTCGSGPEAFEKLGIQPANDSLPLPALLVLDIMMPRTDGYAIGRVVRGTPRTRGIPILVVSALRELNGLFTSTVHVDGLITKPFAPEDLIAQVRKILEKPRA